MSRTTLLTSVTAALAATTLLGLKTACSDPGASAASGAGPSATAVSAGVKQFNLSP